MSQFLNLSMSENILDQIEPSYFDTYASGRSLLAQDIDSSSEASILHTARTRAFGPSRWRLQRAVLEIFIPDGT